MHELRAVTLSGYLDAAARAGIDGHRMLHEAGISAAALRDRENRLPASVVVKLIDQSAHLSANTAFGLLLAENRSFASAGPVSLLLERVATTRDVIEAGIEYRRLFNDVVSLGLNVADETATVRVDLDAAFAKVPIVDLAVAMTYRFIRGASGQQWQPAVVHCVRDEPSDLAPWKRNFSAPVQFNSHFNGFECSSAALEQPIPLADEMMEDNARRLLALMPLTDQDLTLSERTRQALKLLLPEGQSGIERTANQLAVSPKSLQRTLLREGHSFTSLLNDVRRELAEYYLCCSSQSVTAIALHLGYSSLSTFSRWFVVQFGIGPRAWRSAQRIGASAPVTVRKRVAPAEKPSPAV